MLLLYTDYKMMLTWNRFSFQVQKSKKINIKNLLFQNDFFHFIILIILFSIWKRRQWPSRELLPNVMLNSKYDFAPRYASRCMFWMRLYNSHGNVECSWNDPDHCLVLKRLELRQFTLNICGEVIWEKDQTNF